MCINSVLYYLIGILSLLVFTLTILLRYYVVLSQTDEITSIKNYRGFCVLMRKILLKHRKGNTPFTLVLIDIDRFRNYNSQGYAFGDYVLKEFVQFLKQELPFGAKIARFKFGDEFVIVIPNDFNATIEKINQIQESFRLKTFTYPITKQSFEVRFSYGASQFDEGTQSLQSLLFNAENSLKENKEKVIKCNEN